MANVSREGRTKPYEVISFTLAPVAVNVDIKTTIANAFTKIALAKGAIFVTSGDITIKLNSSTDDAIPLTGAQQTITLPSKVEFSNLFMSSTPGANVTVILL